MGDIAETKIEGTLCSLCGCIVDGTTPGYPRNCETCKKLMDVAAPRRHRRRRPKPPGWTP